MRHASGADLYAVSHTFLRSSLCPGPNPHEVSGGGGAEEKALPKVLCESLNGLIVARLA